MIPFPEEPALLDEESRQRQRFPKLITWRDKEVGLGYEVDLLTDERKVFELEDPEIRPARETFEVLTYSRQKPRPRRIDLEPGRYDVEVIEDGFEFIPDYDDPFFRSDEVPDSESPEVVEFRDQPASRDSATSPAPTMVAPTEYARLVQFDDGHERVMLDLQTGQRNVMALPANSPPADPERTFRILSTSEQAPQQNSVQTNRKVINIGSDGVRFEDRMERSLSGADMGSEFVRRRRRGAL